jgi:ABC-type dipeptide/oligopeptide/nickel transport system permease component
MPPLLRFLIRRLTFTLATLVLITAILYGIVILLAPPEVRAIPYLPHWRPRGSTEGLIETTIKQHGLDDPYPVQYVRWASSLLQGDWGWSPALRDEVLDILLKRTPATAELILFSVLLFIPLGLVSGVLTGQKRGFLPDHAFRLLAFVATSIPPFVLGLMLLGIFYVGLHWFSIGRISITAEGVVQSSSFKTFTKLLTVDGLLNGRLDITLSALRSLALPAFTLSLAHWATLGRVTRAAMIEELNKDYVVAARAKGLSMRQAIWRHALRNAMAPAISSSALSTASLVTGTFVVEIVFGFPGISAPITVVAAQNSADVALAMGLAVYSVLLVLPLMLVLDVILAIVDPRIREGGAGL